MGPLEILARRRWRNTIGVNDKRRESRVAFAGSARSRERLVVSPTWSVAAAAEPPTIRCVITRIKGLPKAVIGMRAVGTFDVADYVATIEPEVERIEATRDDLRVLLHLGPDFDGFGDGDWGDLTKELRATPFHRGAVVTDDAAIRTGLALLRFTLHGQVRSFGNEDYDKAAAWVAA